jgi:hypothetical protein
LWYVNRWGGLLGLFNLHVSTNFTRLLLQKRRKFQEVQKQQYQKGALERLTKDTNKENWAEPERARDRQSEEGWCSPKVEKSGPRRRARNNEPTAQMDIEPGVNIPLTVHN